MALWNNEVLMKEFKPEAGQTVTMTGAGGGVALGIQGGAAGVGGGSTIT